MDSTTLPVWWPAPLRAAVTAKTAGATGVARLVIDGLLEIADDRRKVSEAAEDLSARLPGYAPLWHIANAARSSDPASALREIRDDLEAAVPRSVAAATAWLAQHPGAVAVAPSSSIVTQVLAQLGPPAAGGEPVAGLAGADAIGATAILNIKGTGELASRLPTLVVTTALKLVPETVFSRLGAPVFERIPLSSFAAVVLDGEIVQPEQAGQRAMALAE